VNNIIKHISFKNTKYEYYNYPILTADEEDRVLLDSALTNMQSFHRAYEYSGVIYNNHNEMIKYPKFHRGEKYQLPINEYYIKQYVNVRIKIHFGTIENFKCGEGRKVEIVGDCNDNYSLDKVYPLLNFEGRSWQHFLQDCMPMLMFGIEFLRNNPEVDLLIYRPDSWSEQTFLEVMKYFNLDNKVIFIPYGRELEYNVRELYNFEAEPVIPVCWWNTWFYEEAHSFFSNFNENKNVILIKRVKSRIIENFDEISKIFKDYADENNLNYYEINPSEYTASDLFRIFGKAHTVLSPNGGASFHMLFCNQNTKFIEVGFTNWMYTLYNIASAIRLKYYIIPVSGENNTISYYLNPEKIKKILE